MQVNIRVKKLDLHLFGHKYVEIVQGATRVVKIIRIILRGVLSQECAYIIM